MEALRRVAGVTDYSYGPGGDDVGSSYSRVMLRGFDKGALVMVNGAPVNVNNYASVNSIPLDAIDRIEVVKGANSVLYGPEALGGVINIITKKEPENPYDDSCYWRQLSQGLYGHDPGRRIPLFV